MYVMSNVDTRQNDDVTVMDRHDEKLQKPKMFSVLIHNDDFTPFDFVTSILERIFKMNADTAQKTAADVHVKGIGVAGTYTYEIAETKLVQAMQLVAQTEHPLQLSMQEA